MTAHQEWVFPKNWMPRDRERPVNFEWKRPKAGLYTLRYEGHDLKVTIAQVPSTQKRYTIWVDGVAVEKSWSAADAKSRAILLVVRARKEGKPLVPLAEAADPVPEAAKPALEAKEPVVAIAEPTPANALSVDVLHQTQFEIETIQSQRESSGSLYFTISGKLNITSLPTLEGIVELLRESGSVTCTVTLPSRISL
jgi:hypothetical protein